MLATAVLLLLGVAGAAPVIVVGLKKLVARVMTAVRVKMEWNRR